MNPPFTFTTPKLPREMVEAIAEMDSHARRGATIYMQYLEITCREALLRHLGRIPEPEEITKHATQFISPDGARVFKWDDEVFLTTSSPYKPRFTPTV